MPGCAAFAAPFFGQTLCILIVLAVAYSIFVNKGVKTALGRSYRG